MKSLVFLSSLVALAYFQPWLLAPVAIWYLHIIYGRLVMIYEKDTTG